MLNWDDLRIFLAAARRSSYQDAASALGLDATTISRRVSRLEDSLRCTLLVRGPAGLSLTTAGRRLFEAASSIEVATEGLSEAVAHDAGWGVVRLSTSEGFGTSVIASALPDLISAFPKLQIEIVANAGFLSPATRQVDLAITLSAPQDARLAVERLTDYALGLYASRSYLSAHGTPRLREELKDHRLVGYIDDLLYANELRYLDEVYPNLQPTLSSSSIRAQGEIIAAGGGIGMLPCFLAGEDEALARVLAKDVRLTRTFWMSARRDVQQTLRVRTVRKWIRDIVAKKRVLLLPAV